MFNSSRAEANSTNKSFVPHLRRMLEPEVTDTHIYYPHHMLPRFNQIRTENAPLGAFHLSAHVAAQPTPVPNRTPKLLAAYTSDPVFQLSRKKEVHLTRLRQLRHRYDVFVNHKSFKKAMQNHAGRKDVHLNCVREFAEELEHDPDEYFDGGYDWYWSGSTMAVIPRPEGGDWLVHVEASDGQLNQLKFSHITAHTSKSSKSGFLAKPTSVRLQSSDHFDPITAALAPHGHIYELHYAQRPDRLCVRQKLRITIIDPSRPRLLGVFVGDVPFVSAAFDAACDRLVAVDVQRRVHVYALGANCAAAATTQPPLHSGCLYTNYKAMRLNDRWSAVRSFDTHVQAVCDRETVRLFDVRAPFDGPQQPLYAHQFSSYMERCEQLTCMEVPSTRSHSLLVGASHKLFAVDVRMFDVGDAEEGAASGGGGPADLLHFTHQLHSLPTMISVLATTATDRGAGELIAIGAQLPGNVRLCETLESAVAPGSRAPFGSRAMPYRPPSMWDSYQLVRRRGDCLDARCMVPQQLKASITGLQLWRNGDTDAVVFLLQQNSAGDVFVQTVNERTGNEQAGVVPPADSKRVLKAFHVWDEQLQQLQRSIAGAAAGSAMADSDGEEDESSTPTRQFMATDLTYFRAMADVVAHNVCNPFGVGGSGMVDIPSAIPAGTAAIAAVDADPSERAPRWRKPLKQIRMYKDALAPSLLEVWNMPECTEEDGDGLDDQAAVGRAGPRRTKADRISAWLERTSTQQDADAPMDELDVSVSTIGVGTQPERTQPTEAMDDVMAMKMLLVPDAIVEESAVDRVERQINAMQKQLGDIGFVGKETPASRELAMLEMTLEDASQFYTQSRPTASGRPAKKKAKKVRAFVPGF